MMRTVEDAATVLELLVNQELSDLGPQNYTQVLSRNGLQGLTVGFDPTALQLATMPQLIPSQDVSDLFTQALAQIQQAGATTKQVNALTTLLPSLEQVTDLSFQCMPVDFKQSINSYLGGLGPNEPIQSLSGLIANGQFLNTVSSFLNQAQASTDTIASSSACQQYISAKAAAAGAIVSFLDSQGLDLLVYPAANQPPYPIGTPPAGWYGFQALSSPTGLPSLTMPMGIAAQSGAPVGLIFLARSYQESKLVQAAYALQEQLHPRTPPLLPM